MPLEKGIDRVNIKNKKILEKVQVIQIAHGIANPSRTLEYIIQEYLDRLNDDEKLAMKKAEEIILLNSKTKSKIKQKELV